MALKRKHQPDEIDLEAAGHAGAPGNPGAPGEADDDAESLAAEFAQLERERDELVEKYQRALADFRNYQQRALANEREARLSGATGVLHSVIRVLDYFELALGQDPAKATAEQILGGVRLIRDELARAVGAHGVSTIEPQPNDEFDPQRHEAVREQEGDGVAPGNISLTLQSGYAMGDRVLRPAKVAVAPRPESQEA